ncbi:hypothetical protein FSARC_7582 [Fusarium sarcochroum]|uniref:Uncharacterized protein n=1 Tax=Fusarium sarcochroum TaxID=1208366 RepID=A0A8H4X770_9HYPO|nr:hypothetical protein FSARC_7582 [Fusarium sarcochroum]
MPSHTTTSLLLPSYSGNFVAQVIGANPTATTFVLDCDWDKYPNKDEEDCYVTQQTVIVGPWADKTPTPGAATTGLYKESYVYDDGEDSYSFSAQCDMSKTYAKTCTTINIGGNDNGSPTATFPRSSGTTFDGFYYFAGYGAFYWVPVTVTDGQEHLLAAKTAASTDASATSDLSGASNAAGATTESTGTVDKDLVTVTGEATSTKTSSNDACTSRSLSLGAVLGLVAAVALL